MTEKLVKTKKRVADVGEVFTPRWLVDEVLEAIPKSVFEDSEKTFIDPACGDGNFLVVVLEQKMEHGVDALQAISTIYGVDIMPDNVLECRQRLFKTVVSRVSNKIVPSNFYSQMVEILKKNIQLGDTLQFDIEDILSENPSSELQSFRSERMRESKKAVDKTDET